MRRVYVIGIGGVGGHLAEGRTLPSQLAAEDRRPGVLPVARARAAVVQRRLARDVQHRYLIVYTPQNQQVDGTWRRST